MKNIFAIVTFAAAMSGCAAVQTPAVQAGETAVSVASAGDSVSSNTRTGKAQGKAAAAVEDPLPTVALTEELMYRFLEAELADQRGDWRHGYISMLSLAQQTRDPRIARRAFEIAWSARQPTETLSAVRLWRQLAPNSPEAAQYFLGFAIATDNLAEARPVLQQQLQRASVVERGTLILQSQQLLARARSRAAAFTLLEELLAPYRSIPETHIALAQAAIAQGNSSRALAEARLAIAAKPDSERAALTLAQVISDKKEALKSLATFLEGQPKARVVRLTYAQMLSEQNQFDGAEREFLVLLKDQPNDLTVLYMLGLLRMQKKDLDGAERYLTTFLSVLDKSANEEHDSTQALLALAQIATERGDSQAALRWLDQIDESASPQAYVDAQIRRAQLVAKSGNLVAARQLLADAKAGGEREQVQLLIAEAQLLRDAAQHAQAMEILNAGLKRFPDNTDLLYDHAMVADKLDQLDAMETSLRRIMKLAPDNQHAYNALGYMLADRNQRLPEALALIEKALQLAPEDPFIMDSMGWVLFRLGKNKEAEDYLRRAYAIRPDAEIAVHLGEVLWVKGQQEDAKKFWRDANTKDPKSDALKSTLARLHVQL